MPNLVLWLCLAVIVLNLLAWYKLNQKVNQLRRPAANPRRGKGTRKGRW